MSTRPTRYVTLAAIATAMLVAASAPAQTPRSTTPANRQPTAPSPASSLRFAIGGGLSIPAGDLGRASDAGFSLGMRAEGRLRAPNWFARGDLTFDRFDGRGVVNAYSYTSLTASLVHRAPSTRFYQFGGLGVYNARTAFVDALDRSDTNLGVHLGLGVDMSTTAPRWFAEAGFASAFTSGRSSLWFPVRIGFWL